MSQAFQSPHGQPLDGLSFYESPVIAELFDASTMTSITTDAFDVPEKEDVMTFLPMASSSSRKKSLKTPESEQQQQSRSFTAVEFRDRRRTVAPLVPVYQSDEENKVKRTTKRKSGRGLNLVEQEEVIPSSESFPLGKSNEETEKKRPARKRSVRPLRVVEQEVKPSGEGGFPVYFSDEDNKKKGPAKRKSGRSLKAIENINQSAEEVKGKEKTSTQKENQPPREEPMQEEPRVRSAMEAAVAAGAAVQSLFNVDWARASSSTQVVMQNIEKWYTTDFSPEWFLRVVPDPSAHFSDCDRGSWRYAAHSLFYLKTKFRRLYTAAISEALRLHRQNLYLTHEYLAKKSRGLKSRSSNRSMSECNTNRPTDVNMQFFLEVAYIEHDKAIKAHIKKMAQARKTKLKNAERTGQVKTCERCNGNELLQEEVVECPNHHVFCGNCLIKHLEGAEGTYGLECLAACQEKYTLKDIHRTVTPQLFSKVVASSKEVFAEVDGLTECPHCHQFDILPTDAKILGCVNLLCLRLTCRSCKQLCHEPFDCQKMNEANVTF